MPIAIDGATTQVVLLDDLKRHLRIPVSSNRDDAELALVAGAAVDAVEGIIGPILHRSVSETVSPRRGEVLLSTFPVVSVTSLAHDDTEVDHALSGGVGLITGIDYNATLSVTYVAGRTVVPDAVVMAILIIARHLWNLQRGNAPQAVSDDEFLPDPGLGYAIPARAQDLLAPYARPPVVA